MSLLLKGAPPTLQTNPRAMKELLWPLVVGAILYDLTTQTPTLTEANFPVAGYEMMYFIDDSVRPMFPDGIKGTNLIWGLQNAVEIRDTKWIRYYYPSQTPYAGLDPCVDTSDYAERLDSLRDIYVFVKIIRGPVTYYVSQCVGATNVNQKLILKPLDMDTIAFAPATYGDVLYEDGVYWTWMLGLNDTLDVYSYNRHVDSANAWGTVVLPDGTSMTVLGIKRKQVTRIVITSRATGSTLFDRSDSVIAYELRTTDTTFKSPVVGFGLSFTSDSIVGISWSSLFEPQSPTPPVSVNEPSPRHPSYVVFCDQSGCYLIVKDTEIKEGSFIVSTMDGKVLWQKSVNSISPNTPHPLPVPEGHSFIVSVESKGKVIHSTRVVAPAR